MRVIVIKVVSVLMLVIMRIMRMVFASVCAVVCVMTLHNAMLIRADQYLHMLANAARERTECVTALEC
jgi:hypothetical protein